MQANSKVLAGLHRPQQPQRERKFRPLGVIPHSEPHDHQMNSEHKVSKRNEEESLSVALRTELKAREMYLLRLKQKRKIISTEKYVKMSLCKK